MHARGDRRARLEALPILALAIVAGGYLWEVLSLSGIPVARDVQMFFLPQKRLLAESLARLEVPLWTPHVGTGAPFLANLQSGVFYPPHWLYATLPFYAAFNLLLVLHLVLGGAFAYLLCRRLGVGVAAAWVGAVTWMLGGYAASLLNLVNALQAAAWAPGLAWAALRAVEERGGGPLAVLVLVGTCAALAGEPQSALLAGLATAVLLGFRIARLRPGRSEAARIGGRLALAAIFVVGLAMIQLLPTLELLRESGRGAGLAYAEAATFDLDPVRLIHLIVPPDYRDPEYVFGVRSIIGRGDPWLFSIYLGAAFPLLLAFALADRERRGEGLLWCAIGVAGILIALGEHTPVFGWLYEHAPGFGSFRFPEKYFFLTAFSSLILAARGAERLFVGARLPAERILAALYVGLPALFFTFLHARKEAIRSWAAGFGNDRMFEDFDWVFGVWSGNVLKLTVLCALFAGLVWARRRGHLSARWLAILSCALVTGDLAVAHRNLNPAVERDFYESEPLVLRHVPLERIRTDYRYRSSRFDSLAGSVPVLRGIPLEAQKWVWQQTMAPNVGQAWGVLQPDAWDAIKLRRWVDERDLHRAIPDAERRWKLLRLHSVRWVHSIIDVDPAGAADRVPLDTLPGYLFELRDPLPRAYLVPEARVVPDPTAAINYVLSAGFDPASAAVLIDPEAPPPEPPADAARPVRPARLLSSEPHRVRIAVDAEDPGWLVLTDSYYPGWRAFVDGEERPIELANFFFRAVPLRPGDREVTFVYRSAAFETGRLASAVALALGLALLAWGRLRAGRRRPEPLMHG